MLQISAQTWNVWVLEARYSEAVTWSRRRRKRLLIWSWAERKRCAGYVTLTGSREVRVAACHRSAITAIAFPARSSSTRSGSISASPWATETSRSCSP